MHVDKHKPSTNCILVAYYDVEGHGHGPLGFYLFIKASFNLLILVTEGLKTGFLRGGGGGVCM